MTTSDISRNHLGSFSPASPPYYLVKGAERTKRALIQPQTPVSPSRMPSTSPTHASSKIPPQTSGFTPPSSAAMSRQNSQQDMQSTMNAPSGPAIAPTVPAGQGHKADEDVMMTGTEDHRRSDHERNHPEDEVAVAKQSLHDQHAEGSALYKFCENPFSMSRPHPSQDLITLYGLNGIAASVARKDPVTGQKINKIRRSYDGKIKQLGIAGKNKSVKKVGELAAIMDFPDEEWQNQKVFGKDISRGLPDAIQAKLERALKMIPAKLPNGQQEKWEDFVNLDDSAKTKPPANAAPKKPPMSTSIRPGALPDSQRPLNGPSPTAESARPRRSGKKRRYDDDSFEGYGEGYVDDMDRSGFSTPLTEEESRGSAAKKKRRREYAESGISGFDDRSRRLTPVGVGGTPYGGR